MDKLAGSHLVWERRHETKPGARLFATRTLEILTIQAYICKNMFLDVQMPAVVPRLVRVYMPHAEYADIDVEAVYAALEASLLQARRRGYKSVLAGDFNVEIGQRQEDDAEIVGDNRMPKRNA